jgi:TPR repeat protein
MEIICRASTGSDAPGVGARVSTEAGLSALCVRNGELLVCDDAETDARVDREACRSLGIRSIVAVPIFQESTVVGLIEVFSREAGSFDADAKLILQYLAETVALALDRTSYSQRHSQRPPDPATFSETSELNEEEHNAPRSWFRRALLALALLTVLGAVLWVLLPHARNSVPAPVQPAASQPTKQGAISAPVVFDRQRKLAEQGDAAVQFAVGARYATGDGIDQDYAEAARWFSMAAAQGNVSAEGTLAAYYLSGTGVSKDFSKAYFWALLAQAGGDQASKYRVAILASRMTRAQLVAVQEQANQWLNDHRSISPAP